MEILISVGGNAKELKNMTDTALEALTELIQQERQIRKTVVLMNSKAKVIHKENGKEGTNVF